MTIYSNTTPMLAFSAIGCLDLINKVHGEICIVPSVVAECGILCLPRCVIVRTWC